MSTDLAIARVITRVHAADGDVDLARRAGERLSADAAHRLAAAWDGVRVPRGEWCVRRVQVEASLDDAAAPGVGDRGATDDLGRRWADAVAAAVVRALVQGSSDVVRYADVVDAATDAVVGLASGRPERQWAWRQLGVTRAGDPVQAGSAVLAVLRRQPELALAALEGAVERGATVVLDRALGSAGWAMAAEVAWRAAGGGRLPRPAGPAGGGSGGPPGATGGSRSLGTAAVGADRPAAAQPRPAADLGSTPLAGRLAGSRVVPSDATLDAWAALVGLSADPTLARRPDAGRRLGDLRTALQPLARGGTSRIADVGATAVPAAAVRHGVGASGAAAPADDRGDGSRTSNAPQRPAAVTGLVEDRARQLSADLAADPTGDPDVDVAVGPVRDPARGSGLTSYPGPAREPVTGRVEGPGRPALRPDEPAYLAPPTAPTVEQDSHSSDPRPAVPPDSAAQPAARAAADPIDPADALDPAGPAGPERPVAARADLRPPSDVAAEGELDCGGLVTEWAGLAFLLATAGEAGLPDRLMASSPLAARPAWWVLHLVGALLSEAPADDPGRLALAGCGDWRLAELAAAAPATSAERAAAAALADDWTAATAARLIPPAPATGGADGAAEAVGAEGAGGGTAAALLRRVVRRPGHVLARPGWIEVHLPLADVDLDVRRAGLDADPGWVGWLGAVVRHVYE